MRLLRWIKHRLTHKLEHFKLANLKKILKEHGIALIVIVILWEIIEDILFPLLFIFLGSHVHPVFYAGAPASWLLCVHWLVVPLTWKWWVKLKGEKVYERSD
jgi:hypothetical protein